VYEWAVSIICTPAATALLMNAMFSGVFVSRFVPSPIRPTSMSPSFTVRISVFVPRCQAASNAQ